jgi:tRNA (guanine37-N1)-methyltransferase
MKIDILTLFPQMFTGPFSESIIKRAQEKNLVQLNVHDLRQWTNDNHQTVDDRPYGGGPGMVMMIEPIDKALSSLKPTNPNAKVIVTSAKGERYTQQKAHQLSQGPDLILIAGHYEGIDHRVYQYLADEVISIGDYVLTGGELPAMVIVDSIIRLVPGVVGESTSIIDESHKEPGFIEYPQYTRPEEYRGWKVPEVLLSGNHAAIEKWRQTQSRQQDKK